MTTLTGRTPKDTYKDLLQVSNGNTGIDAILRHLEDGEGTQSPLKVSTLRTDSYMPQSVVGPFLGSSVLPIATTGNFPGVSATSSRGTEASPTQLATGDLIGKYDFWGWMGSATPAYVPMAGWYAKVNGATANDKGADLLLYQKTDNNIGYYNTWKFANTGQLFSGGYYNHIGIMTSQNDGGFLSGALNTQDPGYFLGDNTYQMCFNDPATGGIGSAHGVFAATGLNGTYLTLGASGYGEAYNGIFQYAQPGAAVWDVHDLNDISIFYFTDTGIARFNDGFFTRLGTTIGPSTAGQAGDGALNIYQEGGGSYWQLWLDKSDTVKGSYSDALFDVMDADVNTNKNITCLNLQASNTIIGASASIAGQCGAGNLTATSSIEMLNAATRMYIKEGTGGSSGVTTLVAGVATITISGMTTASRAFVEIVTPGGTIGTGGRKVVCTANTLTITSISTVGITQALDTSTLRYWFFNAT